MHSFMRKKEELQLQYGWWLFCRNRFYPDPVDLPFQFACIVVSLRCMQMTRSHSHGQSNTSAYVHPPRIATSYDYGHSHPWLSVWLYACVQRSLRQHQAPERTHDEHPRRPGPLPAGTLVGLVELIVVRTNIHPHNLHPASSQAIKPHHSHPYTLSPHTLML